MKSSKRIIFELNKESSLDKAVEILEAHEKEVAIKFAGYYKTKIFRLSDNPAIGDYLRSELFDEWQKQK